VEVDIDVVEDVRGSTSSSNEPVLVRDVLIEELEGIEDIFVHD
jgi:hypothetical protein